jgi:hypothetical protein
MKGMFTHLGVSFIKEPTSLFALPWPSIHIFSLSTSGTEISKDTLSTLVKERHSAAHGTNAYNNVS